MCGIAGSFGPLKNKLWATSQIQLLKLRGPDSQNYLEVDSQCQMVACRLAMTDPTPRSDQPFKDLLSGNVISFNGEIYNYREIRAELLKTFPEEPFITNSDTEVLLRVLDKFGQEGLARVQGMFAFAYYRRTDQELWLGRDFLGKKPLYWTIFHETVFWSSSQESFRRLGKPQFSQESLLQFLSLGYLIDPTTMNERAFSVMPGTLSVFDIQNKVRLAKTKKIDNQVNISNRNLRELISDATECRIEGHDKVALSLSGGVDSSVIALRLAHHGDRIKSFSSIWTDSDKERYNIDAKIASHLAHQLGINHQEVEMPKPQDVPDYLDKFLLAMEEPNGNPTGISLYALYQAISSDGFRLVLTGDGSDEIFGGYQRYTDLSRIPNFLRLSKSNLLKSLIEHRERLRKVRAGTALAISDHSRPECWLYWHLVIAKNELGRLLAIENFEDKYESALIKPIESSFTTGEKDAVYSLMERDHSVWLDMESNRKLDRVSMHFSIEARSPFQDERVVQWAKKHRKENSTNLGDKRVLRLAFPELKELGVRTDKAGFISPVGHWLRSNPTLISASIKYLKSHNYFDPSFINSLASAPEKGNFRKIKQLWHLIVWSRWAQIYGE